MTPEDISRLPYRPCVGVMLINSAGRVFVGERIDTPGAWQMPQGGIDPGESVQQAGLRELWEETGVRASPAQVEAETPEWVTYDLPHDLVPKLWKGRFRGQKQKWVLIRHHGRDSDIVIDGPHPEFSRWKWVRPEDVLAQIVPFKRGVYEAVLEAFDGKL